MWIIVNLVLYNLDRSIIDLVVRCFPSVDIPSLRNHQFWGVPNPISWEMGRRWFLELGLPGLGRGGKHPQWWLVLQNVAGKHVVTRGYTIYKYSNTCWSKENKGIWCFIQFYLMRKHMKTLEPLKDGNRQETLLLGWWRNWGFLAWQFLDFAVEAAKRGLRKLGKTGDWSVRSIFGGFHKWGGSPKWMVYGNLYLDPLIADIAVGVFVFELHLIDEKELKWFSRCFW